MILPSVSRHVLWIRDNHPGAKTLIFSQYREFLEVLTRAFKQFKIGSSTIDKKGGVEKFRQDPRVCFSILVETLELTDYRSNASCSMPEPMRPASTWLKQHM
jgi:hypothetical protein